MVEELYDIVDENDKPLGFTKPKSEVHRDGDWHRSAHVWVLNSKGELLIQKRAPHKLGFPDHWDVSVGGHLSAGEKPIESAIREMEEEIGLTGVQPEQLEFLFVVNDINNDSGQLKERAVHYVYLLRANPLIGDLKLQESEVSEAKFIPYKDLRELIESGTEKFVPHNEYNLLFEYLDKNL
jgi:isopentenyldiphosphate isomerase